MPASNSTFVLCEKIYTLLFGWGIEKKVVSMTLDNASLNNVFIDLFKGPLTSKEALLSAGEFFHIHSHILNLIIQIC